VAEALPVEAEVVAVEALDADLQVIYDGLFY
jgi:hypothetical protein